VELLSDIGAVRTNLKRTEVRASVNGFITNLNLAKGTYASQGKPVIAA
jgi:multidrug resistance efflux pump